MGDDNCLNFNIHKNYRCVASVLPKDLPENATSVLETLDTEYKHTEDYLKRKTIEKYVRCFVDWPPCSWPVTAHAPFTLLTLRMCSYWLRTWRPHMYTPFAHAFAYAIKQTPYAFVSKIILCMYLLYALEQR